jgi:hypothetical protein
MSAFQCSDLHIYTIAAYAADKMASVSRYIDRDKLAQDLADRLKRANVHSVNYRYNEKTPARKCKPLTDTTPAPAPVVYRLFQCWNYQACEDSNALDYLALAALMREQFSPEDIEASKPLDIWTI